MQLIIDIFLFFFFVGISNTAETDYIQLFCKHANDLGYCVAVLNHTGALKNQEITGNRIFTYGKVTNMGKSLYICF